jgi:hypothetical protein
MSARHSDKDANAFKFEIFVAVFIAILLLASIGQSFRAVRLPILIGSITLVLIGIDMVNWLRSCRAERQMAAMKPSKTVETAGPGVESGKKGIDKKLLVHLAGTIGFMVATILLWEILGYIPTAIAVIIGFGFFLGVKNKIILVITAILLSVLLFVVFGVVLGVPLPWGLIPPFV